MVSKYLQLLSQHSDFYKARGNALHYYNENLYFSTRKNKKYMIHNPITGKHIHFGDIRYSDYLSHGDEDRRMRYLNRTSRIKGRWKDDEFSPNNLSRRILWEASD